MDMRIPPRNIKIIFESSPTKIKLCYVSAMCKYIYIYIYIERERDR